MDSVVLIIECCGQRSTPEAAEAVTSALGKYADTLSSGGVVLGPRLPAAQRSEYGPCNLSLAVRTRSRSR